MTSHLTECTIASNSFSLAKAPPNVCLSGAPSRRVFPVNTSTLNLAVRVPCSLHNTLIRYEDDVLTASSTALAPPGYIAGAQAPIVIHKDCEQCHPLIQGFLTLPVVVQTFPVAPPQGAY